MTDVDAVDVREAGSRDTDDWRDEATTPEPLDWTPDTSGEVGDNTTTPSVAGGWTPDVSLQVTRWRVAAVAFVGVLTLRLATFGDLTSTTAAAVTLYAAALALDITVGDAGGGG